MPQFKGPIRPVRAKSTSTFSKVTAVTVTFSRACAHSDIRKVRSLSRAAKMLKRQMFGRAGFHLLRECVLLYS